MVPLARRSQCPDARSSLPQGPASPFPAWTFLLPFPVGEGDAAGGMGSGCSGARLHFHEGQLLWSGSCQFSEENFPEKSVPWGQRLQILGAMMIVKEVLDVGG